MEETHNALLRWFFRLMGITHCDTVGRHARR